MPSLRRPPVILNQGAEHRFVDLLALANSQPWMGEGLCVDYPDSFDMPTSISRKERTTRIKEAISICRSCPVLTECDNWAERTEKNSTHNWVDIVVAGKYYR